MASPRWVDVPEIVNELAHEDIGIAMDVHRDIGLRLVEAPYKLVLAERLATAGHAVFAEHRLPLSVGGVQYARASTPDG